MSYAQKLWRIKFCQILERNGISEFHLPDLLTNPFPYAWINPIRARYDAHIENLIFNINGTRYVIDSASFIYRYENNIDIINDKMIHAVSSPLNPDYQEIDVFLRNCLEELSSEFKSFIKILLKHE